MSHVGNVGKYMSQNYFVVRVLPCIPVFFVCIFHVYLNVEFLFFPSGQQVVHLWSLSSLFSRKALEKLEKESGCARPETKIGSKCDSKSRFRTFDGTCNNRNNLGASNTVFLRLSPARYFDRDGLNAPIGFPGTPNVPGIAETFKVVKEIIKEQIQSERVNTAFTHALMQFGQFLDHDLDLAPEIENSGKCERVRCDISLLSRWTLLIVKYC